jgi:hypothetical protein
MKLAFVGLEKCFPSGAGGWERHACLRWFGGSSRAEVDTLTLSPQIYFRLRKNGDPIESRESQKTKFRSHPNLVNLRF